MITRRSRVAEHSLERRGRPIVLPIIAALLALGGSFTDWQETSRGSIPEFRNAGIGDDPVVSATFQGLTGKGDYYQCVRPAEIRPEHPAYKRLLEACVFIPLPNMLVNR